MRAGERMLNDGVVAARYRFAPRTAAARTTPSTSSSRGGRRHRPTVHHTLPKVNPFRVSRYGFSRARRKSSTAASSSKARPPIARTSSTTTERRTLTLPKGRKRPRSRAPSKRWLLADTEGRGRSDLRFGRQRQDVEADRVGPRCYYGTIGLSSSTTKRPSRSATARCTRCSSRSTPRSPTIRPRRRCIDATNVDDRVRRERRTSPLHGIHLERRAPVRVRIEPSTTARSSSTSCRPSA